MKVLIIDKFKLDLSFYIGLCFTSLAELNFERGLLKKHNSIEVSRILFYLGIEKFFRQVLGFHPCTIASFCRLLTSTCIHYWVLKMLPFS